MYCISVIDGVAHESIPEYDSAFPDIPIESRYSKDILSKCVRSETPVQNGWLYDAASGTFSAPPEPEQAEETKATVTLEPTVAEQIRADVDFIAAMVGVTL